MHVECLDVRRRSRSYVSNQPAVCAISGYYLYISNKLIFIIILPNEGDVGYVVKISNKSRW